MSRHAALVCGLGASVLLSLAAPMPAKAGVFIAFASQALGYGTGCISPSAGGFGPSPQSADIACIDNESAGQATASAGFGHVGALAQQQQTQNFTICTSQYEAIAEYQDSVVFTDINQPNGGDVPVSLNFLFGGTLNSGGVGGYASVSVNVTIDLTAVQQLVEVNSGGVLDCQLVLGAPLCGSVGLSSYTSDTVMVPVNVPVPFDLLLATDAAGVLQGDSALSDFSKSIDFPIGSDLFNLPAGVTANAPDAFIFNNRFVPPTTGAVSEPATLALFAAGVAGLGAIRHRRKAT